MRRFLGLLLLSAFGCRSESAAPLVQVAAQAAALDATRVEITFTHAIDAFDAAAITVTAPFDRPPSALPVSNVTLDGATLVLTTAPQVGGALYAVALDGLTFEGLERVDAPTRVNFRGYGRTDVTITLETDGFVVPAGVDALVTIDANGEYTPALVRAPMTQTFPGVFTVTLSARIDPSRLHAARAVTSEGIEAAQLVTFSVGGADPVLVGLMPLLAPLPEFEAPVDTTPGNGRAPVRLIFDDRYARALTDPKVRLSIDSGGAFDASSARVDGLTPVAGETRVFERVIEVAVDPNRTLDGTSAATFPYVAFLVEGNEDIPQRGTTFVMATERPQVVVVPIGNPAMVPVTFRVDAGRAFVTPDGATRETFAGEGVFLTGELPSAEDGLGRLAADAFTGGERATLEMRERPDAPGVFEKTIFLPKNRPYGWKVVRCPSGRGCAELNRHVVSSGRAFPTVMKNLVTVNQDAAQLDSVRLVDPAHLDAVPLPGGGTENYSNARVSIDGTESESTSVMFKQEAPDLVVTVGEEPVFTPIYVVGTWRDVNIAETPEQIIAAGGTLELSPYDYDDGTQGRLPIIRDLDLPADPP